MSASNGAVSMPEIPAVVAARDALHAAAWLQGSIEIIGYLNDWQRESRLQVQIDSINQHNFVDFLCVAFRNAVESRIFTWTMAEPLLGFLVGSDTTLKLSSAVIDMNQRGLSTASDSVLLLGNKQISLQLDWPEYASLHDAYFSSASWQVVGAARAAGLLTQVQALLGGREPEDFCGTLLLFITGNDGNDIKAKKKENIDFGFYPGHKYEKGAHYHILEPLVKLGEFIARFLWGRSESVEWVVDAFSTPSGM